MTRKPPPDNARRTSVSVELTPLARRMIRQLKAQTGIAQKTMLTRVLEHMTSLEYQEQMRILLPKLKEGDGRGKPESNGV